MLDTRLITFLTVLEEKSYTKTAQKLNFTQPAVTHHIKQLEHDLNVTLFKDTKTFELTSEGFLLKEYAELAMQQLSQFQNALTKQDKRIYNVAFTNQAYKSVKEMNLFKYFSKYKNMMFNFHKLSYDKITKGLLDGTLDFSFIDNSFDSSVFESISLKFEKVIIVCKSDGQFKDKDRITRDQIHDKITILADEKSGMYKACVNAMVQKNIVLKRSNVLNSNTVDTMFDLLSLYDGIAFMYESCAKEYIDTGKFKKLDVYNFKSTQNIYLLYNRKSFLDAQVLALISDIREVQVE